MKATSTPTASSRLAPPWLWTRAHWGREHDPGPGSGEPGTLRRAVITDDFRRPPLAPHTHRGHPQPESSHISRRRSVPGEEIPYLCCESHPIFKFVQENSHYYKRLTSHD